MAVRYKTLFKSKDLPITPGNASLIIQGIAKRKSIRKFVSQSKGNQFRFKIRILPPFYLLSPYQDSQNILEKVPIKQKLRTNILNVSRNPSLIFPIRRVGFELQFACGADAPLLVERFQAALEIEDFKVYVSREVAKYGYPTKFIDNTLEYELTRNWAAYDLIFARAKITIPNQKISNLLASNSLTANEKQHSVDYFLPNHFFSELLSTFPADRQMKVSGSATGDASIIDHSPTVDEYSNLWKLIHLKDATVLHGKVVFSEGQFYLGDNMKIPTFGSSYNQWPSQIFQNRSGRYFSPIGQFVGEPLEQAIFIGGTKNIMHFVVEDLPRIFLSDDFGLSRSAPVIVAKTLGTEILSLIELLSRRQVIQIDTFEMISVQNLYVLDFNNPLMATMSGDKKAAGLLFSATVLSRARSALSELKKSRSVPHKRIFIRRERGLFRPLINARLLQWMLEHFLDFESYFLHEKTLEEIYQIFVGAEVVVAEYGAGLANIIFVEKACKVVEIRGASESTAIEYETLSKKLGHEHYVIIGVGKMVSRYGITRGPYKVNLLAVFRTLFSLK